jgi:(1->4)-alpha-D-glucan 1-alpha-D-glucosylmutase
MAKGLEDTTFYCFNRMIGLNEVGGSPDRNGLTIAEFHEYCAKMQAEHPLTMTTLSTHDTKRADDVRARLAVITELPARWKSTVSRWSRRTAQFKTGYYPDRNTEYFFYQTLVGTWPISVERLTAYMEKAAREAKQHTSWTQQNKEFEDALKSFIERSLASEEFITEVETFVGLILTPGRINSLAQTLLKFTAPGVPDTYQGSELWDLRLVDPDNRGPVDYEARASMLAELKSGLAVEEIMKRIEIGLPKLWLVHCALKQRQEKPECFGKCAEYAPLEVSGPKSEHLIAYTRGRNVITCAPRWSATLGGRWGSTSVNLPEGRWKNVLTSEELNGGSMRIETLLKRFPVALLSKQAE